MLSQVKQFIKDNTKQKETSAFEVSLQTIGDHFLLALFEASNLQKSKNFPSKKDISIIDFIAKKVDST